MRPPIAAARAAIPLSTLFLVLLGLLHVLEPEFDPARRMISEYALGRFGWLMGLAFFAWAGSVAALGAALAPWLRTVGGRLGLGWLTLIGVALIGAGVFTTDPITQAARSPAGVLHAVCGAFVILTFPVAATLVARGLAAHEDWVPARRWLAWATALMWLGLGAFFASIIVSNLVTPGAGRVGQAVLLGWLNRFMVVTYHLWLILVSLRAKSIALRTGTSLPAGRAAVH